MKKLFFFSMCSILLLGSIVSCHKVSHAQVLYGIVYDASMNNIVVITDLGDTVNVSTMDTDPQKVPGVLLLDSVRVTCKNENVDGNEYLKAEELLITAHSPYYYIQGSWTEPNPINSEEVQGFTLSQDGTATSINMATLVMKSWNLEDKTLLLQYQSIGNDQTITGTDTLDIVKLDADSLILSQNGYTVWSLGRQE
ncbi:MAG: lipocalin family protein [Parabacteroides sp.]|nr:lipocalin family protein [Parabacteroides sp.]